MRRVAAELALSAGVLALGAGAAVGTAQLPSEGGYAGVGPNFFPAVIAAGLLALGLWLAFEALTGRWRSQETPAFERAPFLWISAGLFAQMALVGPGGFVIAGSALFACVTRGFGSRRPARDLALGVVLTLGAFFFFTRFLNVSLPAGWLAPLLGGAGI
ncbi:MAG: tripartite tricarboxylate transporter TctB family protein [Betaproteobacteria bacterium]